jgi:hypothetical protein
MNTWQLPHLMSQVLGGEHSSWRWVFQDDESGPIWSLVQKNASGEECPTGIYAVGETLSMPARVFANVTPAALREMSQRALRVQEAFERLEQLSFQMQRMQTRAYRHKRTEEYDDWRAARAQLFVAQRLLMASEMPPLDELLQLETEALAAQKLPPEVS